MAKSLTGDELARQLITVLSVQLSIPSELLVAAMRDCVSSNNVAMCILKVVYPSVLDVGCIAHTLDRVGERFKIPIADKFATYWVSLFSHSLKAKFLWKEKTGRAICGYSTTRWWSKWEVLNQLLELFGDVQPFLQDSEGFSNSTRAKLLKILTNTQQCVLLRLELAAVIDAGKPFVSGTYKLEGNGPLALQCYEIINSITAAVELAHYPNVEAIISSMTSDPNAQQHLKSYTISCIKPALDYYKEHLNADLMTAPLRAFKAARLFSPQKIQEMKPDTSVLETQSNFPFLTPAHLAAMRDEFPKYLQLLKMLQLNVIY